MSLQDMQPSTTFGRMPFGRVSDVRRPSESLDTVLLAAAPFFFARAGAPCVPRGTSHRVEFV